MFKRVYLNSDLLLTVIANKLWRTVHIKDFETVFKLGVNSCEYIFTKSFIHETIICAETQYKAYSGNQLLAIFQITKNMTFYQDNVLNIEWLTHWEFQASERA